MTTKKTSFKEALDKYRQTRNLADTEVRGIDPRTYPGHEMQRRQAQYELPNTTQNVFSEFKKTGFPVFVDGTNVSKFVSEASKLTEVVHVDFSKVMEPVMGPVRASMGRNVEFSPSAFSIMVREVRQMGAALGLTSIPSLQYEGPEYVGEPGALDATVERYLTNNLGPEFLGGLVEKAALDSLLESNVVGDNPVVPVLVSKVPPALQEKLGPKLFSGKFVTAEASDVSPEAVTEVFKNIRNLRKQKKEEK